MAAPSKPPAKKGMNLTKKVGPLPVWAWAAIALIGGYLLYEHYKSSASSTPATSATAPAADTSGSTGDGSGSGSGGSPDTGPTTPTTPYTGQGHGAYTDQSSELLTALEDETSALSDFASNLNGSGGGSTTTTNNYYPVADSGASGSISAQTPAPAAVTPASVYEAAGFTSSQANLITTADKEANAGVPETNLPDVQKSVVTTAPPANSAAAVKASPTATKKAAAPVSGYSQKSNANLH